METSTVTIPARGSFVSVIEGSATCKKNAENPSLLDVFARTVSGGVVLLLRAAQHNKAYPLLNNINESSHFENLKDVEQKDLYGAFIAGGVKKYKRKR